MVQLRNKSITDRKSIRINYPKKTQSIILTIVCACIVLGLAMIIAYMYVLGATETNSLLLIVTALWLVTSVIAMMYVMKTIKKTRVDSDSQGLTVVLGDKVYNINWLKIQTIGLEDDSETKQPFGRKYYEFDLTPSDNYPFEKLYVEINNDLEGDIARYYK